MGVNSRLSILDFRFPIRPTAARGAGNAGSIVAPSRSTSSAAVDWRFGAQTLLAAISQLLHQRRPLCWYAAHVHVTITCRLGALATPHSSTWTRKSRLRPARDARRSWRTFESCERWEDVRGGSRGRAQRRGRLRFDSEMRVTTPAREGREEGPKHIKT